MPYRFFAITLISWIALATAACAQDQAPEGRLSPALRSAADKGTSELVPVSVLATPEADLSRLIKNPQEAKCSGPRIIHGSVRVDQLKKLASIPGVQLVFDAGPREAPVPPDPDVTAARPPGVPEEALWKALKSAPSFLEARKQPSVEPKTAQPKSWYGNSLLGVQDAWNLGVDGSGVMVGVLDTGVDFANPDLMGTEARVSNPASPHHGWPICFDGRSVASYFQFGTFNNTWFVDTSSTPAATIHGVTATADFTIINDTVPELHTFTFLAEGVSGIYHFGLHPDKKLKRDVLNKHTAAVLLVDHPDTAGRGPGYNTAYVDLNGDYDFTDEKPCFLGDEVSYRDVWDSDASAPGMDGFADVSGGMVYFIANGVRPFPAADWLYSAPVPANGSMAAFMINDSLDSGGNHGTLCASAVVAQGQIDGNPPPIKPLFAGPGTGMVQGPARGATVVPMGNYYAGGYVSDFHLFAAYGYDGIANNGDEPNIVSMSFGSGSEDADGWDGYARFLESLNQRFVPQTTWVNSSGNGAPGYGTVNSPAPPNGIHVGACTSYDTCNVFDSIQSVTQVLAGDVQGWSGAGPAANGFTGVSVVAHGAWGSGDRPLNEVGDGWTAWEQWGGTSRSTPEAAGVTALIYHAYKQAHGQWPTSAMAKTLLMNSATDLSFDVFRQGAGRVHAGRAAALALGQEGISVDPPLWTAGDYRGEQYSSYANILFPGDTFQQGFQIMNEGPSPANVLVSDVRLEEFGHTDFAMDTVSSASEVRSFSQPDYLTLFEGPGVNHIPLGTSLVVFEAIYPFETFDFDYQPGDPSTVTPPRENSYRLLVGDWADMNHNGRLYDDSLGAVPGMVEANEIDAGEYMRFNYGYNTATSLKAFVADPLSRMHDGIWVGLQHRYGPIPTPAVHVRIRARYFREVDCPWLTTNTPSVVIPAGGTSVVTATVQVPGNMPLGCYSAKLLLEGLPPKAENGQVDKGVEADIVVVPVSLNVAANLGTSAVVISGVTEFSEPYQNFAVHGDFSWNDRTESGDGRFFFFDSVNPATGSFVVTRTTWQDPPPTDIDTLILGPISDTYTTPGTDYYLPGFGPNRLAHIGGVRSPGRPNWTFQTATGGSTDYSVANLTDGLHGLFVHNILFGGSRFAVPFQVDMGVLNLQPDPLQILTMIPAVSENLTLASTLLFNDFQVDAFGPSPVWRYETMPISQNYYYYVNFQATDAGLIDVRLNSPARDLDLYLYRDGADGSVPDGNFNSPEVIYRSESIASDEFIQAPFPQDGLYQARVYAYAVDEATSYFNLEIRRVQGKNATLTPSSLGTVNPGIPESTQIGMNLPSLGEYAVFLTSGPSDAPRALNLLLPVYYFKEGDADHNNVVDELDLFEVSRKWLSMQGVPAGVDFNHNGELEAQDLLNFLGLY